jgi:hypothetical protein
MPMSSRVFLAITLSGRFAPNGLLMRVPYFRVLPSRIAMSERTPPLPLRFCMYNRYVDGLGTWQPP